MKMLHFILKRSQAAMFRSSPLTRDLIYMVFEITGHQKTRLIIQSASPTQKAAKRWATKNYELTSDEFDAQYGVARIEPELG